MDKLQAFSRVWPQLTIAVALWLICFGAPVVAESTPWAFSRCAFGFRATHNTPLVLLRHNLPLDLSNGGRSFPRLLNRETPVGRYLLALHAVAIDV
jgi:hypothetical protein